MYPFTRALHVTRIIDLSQWLVYIIDGVRERLIEKSAGSGCICNKLSIVICHVCNMSWCQSEYHFGSLAAGGDAFHIKQTTFFAWFVLKIHMDLW